MPKQLFACLWASLITLVMSVAFASANPVGSYDVEGKNPNKSNYTGKVQVTRTGDTYSVRWRVGNTTFRGTGLGARVIDGRFNIGPARANDSMIAVGYASGRNYGIAFFFRRQANEWEGIWAFGGAKTIGRENWFPQ